MTSSQIGNYLRSLRRKSGLSQKELASILDTLSPTQVSRHEVSTSLPDLLAALSYQIVFQIPISEMFPGIYETVQDRIEEELAILEKTLHNSTAKGRLGASIARKLEWLACRRNLTSPHIQV